MKNAQKLGGLVILTFVIAIAAISLSKKEGPNKVTFSKTAMLENVANNIIMPCNQTAILKAQSLNQQSQNLIASPSLKQLEMTQNAWRDARKSWAKCELYDLAGLELMTLHHQIDKLRDSNQIRSVLASQEALTSETLEFLGSSAKGFRVLEVMLFNEEGHQLALDLLQDERRQAYLLALSENLEVKLQEVQTYWTQEGANYAETFMTNEAAGSVKGSINKTFNEILFMLELLSVDRLGYPLGRAVGARPRPEIAMAYLSQSTLAVINANLESIQDVFTGHEGLGLADYLVASGSEALAQDINTQLEHILSVFDTLDESFEAAILNQEAKLSEANAMIEELWILMQVDVANQLGLTVTFKQLDGD